MLLGSLLLLAGVLKAADPGHFQAMLSRYGLCPPILLPYLAPLMIAAEVLLGLALLCGFSLARSLALCEACFYLFSLATASVIYRGLRIGCACFGVFSLKLTLWHPILCLAVAFYLSWRRKHPPPLSGYSRTPRRPRSRDSESSACRLEKG